MSACTFSIVMYCTARYSKDQQIYANICNVQHISAWCSVVQYGAVMWCYDMLWYVMCGIARICAAIIDYFHACVILHVSVTIKYHKSPATQSQTRLQPQWAGHGRSCKTKHARICTEDKGSVGFSCTFYVFYDFLRFSYIFLHKALGLPKYAKICQNYKSRNISKTYETWPHSIQMHPTSSNIIMQHRSC